MKLPIQCEMVGVQLPSHLYEPIGGYNQLIACLERYLQFHPTSDSLSLKGFLDLQSLILRSYRDRHAFGRFREVFRKVGLDPDTTVPLLLYGDFGNELVVGLPLGELNLGYPERIGICIVRTQSLQARIDITPGLPGTDRHIINLPVTQSPAIA